MSEILQNCSECNLGKWEDIEELGVYTGEIKEVFEEGRKKEVINREEVLEKLIKFQKEFKDENFVAISPIWPEISGVSRINNCWFGGRYSYPILAYREE